MRKTYDAGAFDSAAGVNTTKKFGSKRAQFTSRRLDTTVGIRTPCTSHTTVSPTVTPSSPATSRSTEIGYGGA